MTEEQSLVTEGVQSGAGDYDLLLYDYSKHLLSLALISIGGIITLAQSSVGREIPAQHIGIVILILAASGVAALCAPRLCFARARRACRWAGKRPISTKARWRCSASVLARSW